MKKKEKVAHIQAVRRRCLGPMLPGVAEAKTEALKKGDVEAARQINRLRGVLLKPDEKATEAGLTALAELVERGDIPAAYGAHRRLQAQRLIRRCGFDVNELVIANLDKGGESIEVECPECGIEIRLTPPIWAD